MKVNQRSAFKPRRWMAFHCILVVIGLSARLQADSVTLRDGTVIEGTIVSEDSTQLVIQLQFASGTISAKQIVNKTDVARVTRLTAEQQALRDMERAFEQVQEYQLDPNTSEPQSYYDHVIDDVSGLSCACILIRLTRRK